MRKTGQQLINQTEKNIAGYLKNLEQRMGPKSGWGKTELASYNQYVKDQRIILDAMYAPGGKINPKTTYITNSKLYDLGGDEWMYYMKPQEQQVRAMTSRNIINYKYPNLKLGDYTEEHTKHLFERLYKLNGNKTAYIPNSTYDDLTLLYSNLKAGTGEVLEVGSKEWMKVITSHLNKAYGVAGVGAVGSQVE